MKFLKFTKQAVCDFEDIYLYGFMNFGEDQADMYSAKIQNIFETICLHPEIGRLDTRVTPAIRRFDSESHVIFYDVKETDIIIVRLLHCTMDFVRHISTSRHY